MGLGTYLSDKWFGQPKEEELARRAERERLLLSSMKDLQEQYTPEEVASISRRFLEGEGLNLPTKRSKMLPPSEGVDVQERSTLEPLKYLEPSTTIVDKVTGEYKIVPGKNSKVYGNEPDIVDVNILDPETGELKKVGTTTKSSKIVSKPKTPGPKSAKDFQDQVAVNVLKNYFTLEATGGDLEKIRPSAISAAKRFGMSIDQVKEDPSIWQRLMGQEGSDVEAPSFTSPKSEVKQKQEKVYNTDAEVKAAYKEGKLTKDQALSILKKQFGMK